MPYKRRERGKSEGYRVQPVLPRPFGRVGPWQTGSHSRSVAEKIEAYVKECAMSRPEVVDALVRGHFNLRDLWVAKLQSSDALDRVADLLRSASDPLLSAAAETYKRVATDARV